MGTTYKLRPLGIGQYILELEYISITGVANTANVYKLSLYNIFCFSFLCIIGGTAVLHSSVYAVCVYLLARDHRGPILLIQAEIIPEGKYRR